MATTRGPGSRSVKETKGGTSSGTVKRHGGRKRPSHGGRRHRARGRSRSRSRSRERRTVPHSNKFRSKLDDGTESQDHPGQVGPFLVDMSRKRSSFTLTPPSHAQKARGIHRSTLERLLHSDYDRLREPTWSNRLMMHRLRGDGSLRLALLVIVVFALGMVWYAWHAIEQMRLMRAARHEQKLRTAISMFPRNPYEYNQRQRLARARHWFTRLNMRSFAFLGASSLTSVYMAHWHRQRRAQMIKRKSVLFWGWTAAAGMVGVAWGAYMFKVSRQPTIIRTVKRNPVLRGFLYIGSIIVVSLLFYIYRLSHRKPRKQRILEAWRKRKHERHAKRAKEIRWQDVKHAPMQMPPPGRSEEEEDISS